MKKLLLGIAICMAALSCDDKLDMSIKADSIIGFWLRETVYLNGVNSIKYVDFLNDGSNYLGIKKDKSFSRCYDVGTWRLSDFTLKLERDPSSGFGDWTYKIIEQTKNSLTLEIKLTEGDYCCGFDEFNDIEIITIKEVYKKES